MSHLLKFESGGLLYTSGGVSHSPSDARCTPGRTQAELFELMVRWGLRVPPMLEEAVRRGPRYGISACGVVVLGGRCCVRGREVPLPVQALHTDPLNRRVATMLVGVRPASMRGVSPCRPAWS